VRELRDGWAAFTETTWVWVLTVWVACYFLITYAPVFVLGPYIAKHSLGGAGAWGTIVAAEGVGALAGGLIALRARPARPWTTVCTLFTITGAQGLLLAAHAPVGAIAAAALVSGFGFSFGSVIYESGIQRAVAPEKLSRVSAYSWMCSMAFLPAGYALAGPIGTAVGIGAYLVAGAVWIVVTTILVLAVPSVRDFRLRADEGVSGAPAATT
jgi:hypothetical protein